MLEIRIRACHVHGRFIAKDNKRPPFTVADALDHPARDTSRIVLPPASFAHEQEKINVRLPAAIRFIKERKLNETFGPADGRIGIILQGGMYNGVIRALERLGLADVYGNTAVPLYVMNVTYPLIDDEVIAFCRDKNAVLVVEEGQPDYIEQALAKILRNARIAARIVGKGPLPMAGEYTGEGAVGRHRGVPAHLCPGPAARPAARRRTQPPADVDEDLKELQKQVPMRPAGFCTGCPERPIFAAMKLVEKELGEHQVASDIGCHLFSILPPFNIGGTTMGYGLGAASNSAFNAKAKKRSIAVMGDGGFWHNGLTSGIGNAVFNKQDGVIIVVDNNYTAATGGQDILSSRADNRRRSTKHPIEKAVEGHRRRMGAHDRPHLRRRQDARHAEGGADHERKGPEGHRRLVGMHAQPAAPREAAEGQGDRGRASAW